MACLFWAGIASWSMAFVCTAFGQGTPFEYVNDTVLMPIGYDNAERKSYSIMTGFTPTGGGDLEYYLCILEANHSENTEAQLWSGLETKAFLKPELRDNILQSCLYATNILIRLQRPQRVFCCTHDAGLPEKALRKYYLIANTFKMCGYQVSQQDVILSKHSWWMELRA